MSGKRPFDTHIIIHDLDANYEKSLKAKCDQLIYASGKYASCKGVLAAGQNIPQNVLYMTICSIFAVLQDERRN